MKKNSRAATMMRNLSDDDRDGLIAEAGPVFIDARVLFEKKAKQVALAHAYRKPVAQDGPKVG